MVRAKKLKAQYQRPSIRVRFKFLPNLKYKQRLAFLGFSIVLGLLLRHFTDDTFTLHSIIFGVETTVAPRSKEVYHTKEVITERVTGPVWTEKKMVRDPLGRMVEAPTTTQS